MVARVRGDHPADLGRGSGMLTSRRRCSASAGPRVRLMATASAIRILSRIPTDVASRTLAPRTRAMSRSCIVVIVTAAVAGSGCTADAALSRSPRSPQLADSAGVAWIRNFDPVWTAATAWRVDTAHVLRIGAADGDAPHLFTDIRGAARMSDGRIVVVDGATFELRAFSLGGAHLWTAAGKGNGPGEISWYPLHLRKLRGDTLQIEDGLVRLRYDAEGRPVEHATVDWGRAAQLGAYTSECFSVPRFVGELVLLAVRPCGLDGRQRIERSHLRRSTTRLDVLPWSLERADTLGTFLDEEWWVHSDGASHLVVWPPIPVGGRFAVADAPSRMAYATTERYRIFIYDLARAVLIRVIERPEESSPVSANRIARATAEWESRLRLNPMFIGDPQRLNRVLAERERIPTPDSTANLDELVFDELGYLWVGHRPDSGATTRVWAVFGADGVFLGELLLPSGFKVQEIGRDYVLGTIVDEDDVPYVSMLTLDRRSHSAGL